MLPSILLLSWSLAIGPPDDLDVLRELDGEPWPRHTIDDSSVGADGVRLADLDGPRIIRTIGGAEDGTKYDVIALIDLDGDGDLDILTCEEADDLGLIWYENPR